jgi:hypothetical protein
VTFGGSSGFAYDTASPEEQAVFRAVIMHYARPGDTVRLTFLPRPIAVFPLELERTETCQLWHDIDYTVVVSDCQKSDSYLKDFLLQRNERHLINLTALAGWSAMLAETDASGNYVTSGGVVSRRKPRKHHTSIRAGDIRTAVVSDVAVVAGEGGSYLKTLKDAQSLSGMSTFNRMIRAITNSCLTEIERDINVGNSHGSAAYDEVNGLHVTKGVIMSYPRGTEE